MCNTATTKNTTVRLAVNTFSAPVAGLTPSSTEIFRERQRETETERGAERLRERDRERNIYMDREGEKEARECDVEKDREIER